MGDDSGEGRMSQGKIHRGGLGWAVHCEDKTKSNDEQLVSDCDTEALNKDS